MHSTIKVMKLGLCNPLVSIDLSRLIAKDLFGGLAAHKASDCTVDLA